MAYKSTDAMFRNLTDEQEAEFRWWARTHDPEPQDRVKASNPMIVRAFKWQMFHPVVREEWGKRGIVPAQSS